MQIPVRNMLDAIPTPAFSLVPGPNGDPVYTYCNAAWFTLFNKGPDDVYGLTIAEILPGPSGLSALEFHRKALQADGMITYSVSALIGRTFGRLRSTLTPLRDEEGNLTCLCGTTADASPLHHDQIVEMRFENLAREIDSFSSFLSTHMLQQLNRVSLVAADLIDGFVDLGDGKLQVIEQLELDTQNASAMGAEVLARAHATRAATDNDTFHVSDVLETEARLLFHTDRYTVPCFDTIILSDQEVLRVVVRNLLFSSGLQNRNQTLVLQMTAEIDSPGMLALSLQGPRDSFSFALGRTQDSPDGAQTRALNTAIEIIQQCGGEFFAETSGEADILQFTLPGFILTPARAAVRSA